MRAFEIITETAIRSKYATQMDPRVSKFTLKDVPQPFVDAFYNQGIKDPNTIIGHYIVSGKETKARGGSENMDYSATPNQHIKNTFGAPGTAISKMDPAKLNWLKQDAERFGRFIYGGQKAQIIPGKNNQYTITYRTPEEAQAADDGWRYRGGGQLQLTGKDQYAKVGAYLFPDDPDKLLRNPDLVRTDPKIGLDASAAYAKLYGKADTKSFKDPVSAVNDALVSVGGGKKFGPGGRMYGQQVKGINDFMVNHHDPKWQESHKQYYASINKPVQASAEVAPPEQHWYNRFIPGGANILPANKFVPSTGTTATDPKQQGPGVLDTVKQFGQDMYQKFNDLTKPQASLEPHTPAGALNSTMPQGTSPPPAVANNPIKK